ncbi:MAG TPA: SDR family oxidoreductase [Pseudomonadales bacterium]|nr:SDR family oxidoreductase [Pseudomonadales bacterium]
MNTFSGKSTVVTGAASGIGHALARALVARGAVVYAVDRYEAGLQQLQKQLQQTGNKAGKLVTVKLDVTNETAVKNLLGRVVAECHSLDFVFNNAGIVTSGHFEHMDSQTWRRIIDINLWGVIHGTQHAYAIMCEQGHGHIINTASTAGVAPVARSIPYATTKHAVVGLSTSLREEARSRNIQVSVVLPGLVDTGIFSSATIVNDYDYVSSIKRVPLRKISPEQAANAILRGVAANNGYIVFPPYNKLIIFLYRLAPALAGRLLNLAT